MEHRLPYRLVQGNFAISILRSEAEQNRYSDNRHHCRLKGVNFGTLGGNFELSQTVLDRDLVRKQLFKNGKIQNLFRDVDFAIRWVVFAQEACEKCAKKCE